MIRKNGGNGTYFRGLIVVCRTTTSTDPRNVDSVNTVTGLSYENVIKAVCPAGNTHIFRKACCNCVARGKTEGLFPAQSREISGNLVITVH